ncbi:MAG: YncE family protein, partial [Methanobacterium sp.]
VAVSPDGKYAYVAINGEATVSVIDTAEDKVIKTISVGKNPIGIAVSPDGGFVYVIYDSHTMDRIDTLTDDIRSFELKIKAYGITVSPDGKYVYVTGIPYAVSILNTITCKIDIVDVDAELGGYYIYGAAVSPDGTNVYFSFALGGTLGVIDAATREITNTGVAVGSSSKGIAVTQDGKYVYVVNEPSGTVTVIDSETYKKSGEIKVGKNPIALGQFIGKSPIYPPS